MSQKTKLFSFVYLIVFLVQLYAEYIDSNVLRTFSKPLIVVILTAWIYISTKLSTPFHKSIFIGLVFAWIGDVLLMIQKINSSFFILGLIAFLLCHAFYIRAFTLDFKSKAAQKNPFLIWAIIVFAAFCAALFIYLRPHLGTMQIPVLIYAIIISVMAMMAVSRFGRVDLFSFEIIFYGAILFLFSDSMLAYNKFVQHLPNAGLIIMASYMLAQYFIVLGSIERRKLL
ncbi:MAG TPA: lysoplasmalogenase [Hanamia sp.]